MFSKEVEEYRKLAAAERSAANNVKDNPEGAAAHNRIARMYDSLVARLLDPRS